jgi:hypothetical protein
MAPRQKQKTEPAPSVPLPLLYQGPVVLNANKHRDLTVSPSPTGYTFAAAAQSVILAAIEFVEACREYPIIFSPAGDGIITPLALLGLQAGENLYVDKTGAWNTTYIPAYIRRYPFILADTGTQELPVCIDQSFDGLNIEGGQRLFTEQGDPTDYCRQVQAFIQEFQNQPALTAAFTAKLQELGLFRPMDANIQLHDGSSFQLNGLLIVDENSLARLGDVVILDLFRKGYLGLIYTHLASVKNLARLVDLKAARKADQC